MISDEDGGSYDVRDIMVNDNSPPQGEHRAVCKEQDRRSDLLNRYIASIGLHLGRLKGTLAFPPGLIFDPDEPEAMVMALVYATQLHSRSLDDA